MRIVKNPLTDDESISRMELALIRAYVLFDIAAKLVLLGIQQLHDAGQKLGLW